MPTSGEASSGREAEAPEQGTCFGFAIQSTLRFLFLRGGGGDALHITRPSAEGLDTRDELVYEWPPTPEMPSPVQLYRDPDRRRYRLWYPGSRNWIVIDLQAQRIDLPASGDLVEHEQRLWRVPAIVCLLARGDLPLHAAAVQAGTSAIVFAAPGHYGKTTLAAGFHQAGYRLLSEDITCIRLHPRPSVVPGPAVLRMRRDVIESLQLSNVDAVAEDDQRVVLAIAPAVRGDCRPIPIAAVFVLRSQPEKIRLERAPKFQVLRDLMAISFKIETASERATSFTGVAELVRRIPVFNLYHPFEIQALQETVDHIVSHVASDIVVRS